MSVVTWCADEAAAADRRRRGCGRLRLPGGLADRGPPAPAPRRGAELSDPASRRPGSRVAGRDGRGAQHRAARGAGPAADRASTSGLRYEAETADVAAAAVAHLQGQF